MRTKHALIALLAVTATVVITTDASAFHRGRRASSRPIFSSGRPYLFSSAPATPQWTTAVPTASSNGPCECVCDPCCRPIARTVTASSLSPIAVGAK